MSYSVDLWNSFESIGNSLLSNIKGLKNLIDIFNALYLSLESFSSSLKDLYNNYDYEISSHKSLYEGILFFKEDFFNCYNYIYDFMLGIKNEIISPLENTREELLNRYLKYKEDLNNIEEDYEEYINNLKNSKNDFYNSVKDVEDFKITLENEKYNYNEINNKYKKEEDEKINELLKIAKDNQKKYLSNINKINGVQDDYIEKKKNYLNNMQYMEEYIGDCIKDSLRKFILYKMALVRNFQYDSENVSKKFDEININKDIKNFISQHSTNDLIPFKYEFIPYTTNFSKRYKNVLNSKLVKDVCNFITTIFNNDTQIQTIKIMSKNIIDGKKLAEYIFRINNINYSNKEQFYNKKIEEFFSERKKRKNLLQEMNNLRIKGSVFINEFNFNNIANALKECINYIENEKKTEKNEILKDFDMIHLDYESINLIIIISTNLYKINELGNKPRLFLQEKLVDISLFSEFEFWKNLIRYFIINEMHTQKNFNLFESNENKSIQINKMIKNILNKYIYNMKAFNVKTKTINDIIYFFQNYYELDPKSVEAFLIKDEKIIKKGESDDNDNNYFLFENVKEGDNNLVINIPNISFKHELSNNLVQNKIN